MSEVKIMTDDNFNELINSSDQLIIDVWADWCGPCKRTTPVFVEMAKESSKNGLIFAKLDADNNRDAAGSLKITSLPSFLIFEEGDLKKKWAGADVGRLRKEIKNLIED